MTDEQQQQQQQREERMREGQERLRAETLGRVLKYLDRALEWADIGDGVLYPDDVCMGIGDFETYIVDKDMARAVALGRIKAELFCARSVLRQELGVDDD